LKFLEMINNSKHYNSIRLMMLVILTCVFVSCDKKGEKTYLTGPDIYNEDTDFKIVGYLGEGM